jgi:hypothetical protein
MLVMSQEILGLTSTAFHVGLFKTEENHELLAITGMYQRRPAATHCSEMSDRCPSVLMPRSVY